MSTNSLNDVITVLTNNQSLDTITLTNPTSTTGSYTLGTTITVPTSFCYPTINIGSTGICAGTSIGTQDTITFSNLWGESEEWTNCFPDFDRIKKMCEQYPGLKIAYEKFATTYKLVKDHYDTPEDQRPHS